MVRRRGIRADELMTRLSSDVGYQARVAERNRELEVREVEESQLAAPIIQDLREAGVAVASLWDLVNTSEPYPEALPVLLSHLSRQYPERVLASIARALAVPEASFGWETLSSAYRGTQGEYLRQALAAALSAAADATHTDEMIQLARDREHGESRGLLLEAIARTRSPKAADLMADLSDDPLVGAEARRLRKKYRLDAAMPTDE